MTVPAFYDVILPTLKAIGDGHNRAKEIVRAVSEALGLTSEQEQELTPSGKNTLIKDRVGWSRTFLYKAGLLSRPKRGYYEVTASGRKVLENPPDRIDLQFLLQYEGFRKFQRTGTRSTDAGIDVADDQATTPEAEIGSAYDDEATTPEEQIDLAYTQIASALKDELLARILDADPKFFERLVVLLLEQMGYGGLNKDAGQQVGGSHDQGIDGLINQDTLGLDVIYLQAKRYNPESTVGGRALREFIGALEQKGASKGVFLTTSRFTKEAIACVKETPSKRIILIDGEKLVSLMLEYDVGTRLDRKIELKKIDEGFFDEEE